MKYLIVKKYVNPRLISRVLLLQEFYLKIRDKEGVENLMADHLLRMQKGDQRRDIENIKEEFPNK